MGLRINGGMVESVSLEPEEMQKVYKMTEKPKGHYLSVGSSKPNNKDIVLKAHDRIHEAYNKTKSKALVKAHTEILGELEAKGLKHKKVDELDEL